MVTALAVALAVVLIGGDPSVSTVWGQDTEKSKPAPGKATRRGRAADKKTAKLGDPLAGKAKERGGAGRPGGIGTYHYRLKIEAGDSVTLAASYYPAKPDTATPVVLLVHEKDRSAKDFEEPITELKGQGLAQHLQGLGYAVFSFDLRGHGANARKATTDREWRGMIEDLQAVYLFLLDRHNRGELNVARLGVVALGEGANLAAAWAYQPGGAVSTEGRGTDLAALALISPLAGGEGYNFSTLMHTLAPRTPLLLMAGERDGPSHDTVKRVRADVEKVRHNHVELFPSLLHGYKLLRFEPKVTSVLDRFLESAIKLKAVEWEPRYNLYPVTYTDIQIIRNARSESAKETPKDKPAAPK
jgi:hypothetical protein